MPLSLDCSATLRLVSELRTRTTLSTKASVTTMTATAETATSGARLLILLVLVFRQYLFQLLLILLALLHALLHLFPHLLTLLVGQLRTLWALLILLCCCTRLSVRTLGTRTTHLWTCNHLFVFLVQRQHLRLLLVRQLQVVRHALSHLFGRYLSGTAKLLFLLLVTLLSLYCCH